MLREFAAKQQMLSVRHVFTDVLTRSDGKSLVDLLVAIDAVVAGDVRGDRLRALLIAEGDGGLAMAAFRSEVAGLTDAQAGMALGLAYLPVEAVDAAASHMLRPIGLKTAAQAIDPRQSLTLRTRMFVADRLIREPGLQGLLGAVAALAALRANGCHPGWSELAEVFLRPRLLRMRLTVEALLTPAVFAGALSACLRGDWIGAERRLYASGCPQAVDPPRLADLFAVSLFPTCDTLDAVQRIRGIRIRGDADEARLA